MNGAMRSPGEMSGSLSREGVEEAGQGMRRPHQPGVHPGSHVAWRQGAPSAPPDL